jgi:hypothetical protein
MGWSGTSDVLQSPFRERPRGRVRQVSEGRLINVFSQPIESS